MRKKIGLVVGFVIVIGILGIAGEVLGVCTDTDVTSTYPDGKNYYTEGTCNDAVSCVGAVCRDICNSTGSIKEYYCSGTSCAFEIKACPGQNYCSYRVCETTIPIPPPTTPPPTTPSPTTPSPTTPSPTTPSPTTPSPTTPPPTTPPPTTPPPTTPSPTTPPPTTPSPTLCSSCDRPSECGAGETCIGGDLTTNKKEGVCQDPNRIIFCSPITHKTFGALIDAIINFIFTIAMVVVPLLIMIGAFNIMTAGGDAKKIAAGKSIITSALIGLVVILLAKGIIAMLEQVIGIKIGG